MRVLPTGELNPYFCFEREIEFESWPIGDIYLGGKSIRCLGIYLSGEKSICWLVDLGVSVLENMLIDKSSTFETWKEKKATTKEHGRLETW